MSETTEADVRAFLLDRIGERLRAVNVAPEDVEDRTDLLAAGIVDSFGVLELIAAVSDHFGVEGDWEDYEPEDVLVVGPFCRYAASRARSGSADDE
jgi:acyl carrier protein